MSRWGARPASGAVFRKKDSIFLSLLFDTAFFMSVSASAGTFCPCVRSFALAGAFMILGRPV